MTKKYIIYRKKDHIRHEYIHSQKGGEFIDSEILDNLISTESPVEANIINKTITDIFNNNKRNDEYKKYVDY